MKYIFEEELTLNKDMEVGYLYYDKHEEAIVLCTEVKDERSWIEEVLRGKSDIYEGYGFLNHFSNRFDDIHVHKMGPKEDYPELFL